MKKIISYKWEVLILLWFAFFLNQADRQIFNIVLPFIKSDLGLSDFQLGLIASIFTAIFAVLVPIAGYLGDILSRKWIVTSSVIIWSMGTILTGFSGGLVGLIAFRSVTTGGGEAFFAPANYALLSEYHKETRAFAMSIHQTALYAGVILSGYLAGLIAELYNWRYAFFIFGFAGVLLGGILIYRLKDKVLPPDKINEQTRIPFKKTVKVFVSNYTAISITISFACLIFVYIGYLTWSTTFLYEKFDLSLSIAGFYAMLYPQIFSFAGILFAGKYSDKLVKKYYKARMLIQAAGLLLAAPFLLMLGFSDSQLFIYIALSGYGFFKGLFDANTYAALYDVVKDKYRSSISGFMIMIGFLIGSFSPTILGSLKGTIGLGMGMAGLAFVSVFGGIILLISAKYFLHGDVIDEESINELQ